MRKVDPFLMKLQEQVKEQTAKWEKQVGSISKNTELIKKATLVNQYLESHASAAILSLLDRQDLVVALATARSGNYIPLEPFVMVIVLAKNNNHNYIQGNPYLIIDAKGRIGVDHEGFVGNTMVTTPGAIRPATPEEIDLFFSALEEAAVRELIALPAVKDQFVSFIMEEEHKQVGTSD